MAFYMMNRVRFLLVPPRPSVDTFRQDPILKLSNPSLHGERNRIKAET
jgi:hypothetical protein